MTYLLTYLLMIFETVDFRPIGWFKKRKRDIPSGTETEFEPGGAKSQGWNLQIFTTLVYPML